MTKRLRVAEYDQALNLARKARRHGDAVAADRWLRHAERHLALAHREFAFEDAAELRRIELEAAATRQDKPPAMQRERKPAWYLEMKREERGR